MKMTTLSMAIVFLINLTGYAQNAQPLREYAHNDPNVVDKKIRKELLLSLLIQPCLLPLAGQQVFGGVN